MHWILIPEVQIHSISHYDQPFSTYKVVENRQDTKWNQNNLKNFTVESTLYTLNTHPQDQISLRFRLRPAMFEKQGCRKSEKHSMTREHLNYLTIKSTLYTLHTHHRDPNFTPFRSTTSHFRYTRLSKIGNAPSDPRMTSGTQLSTVPFIHWILTPRPNFHSVCSSMTRFPGKWGFCLLHRLQWWIWYFRKKNREKSATQNFKKKIIPNPKHSFVGTIGKEIQEPFDNFQLQFVGGVPFWNFFLPYGPMLTKMKNIPTKSFFFFKNKKIHWHMAQGKTQLKFEKFHAINRESIDATDGRGDGWRTNN